MGKQKEGLNGEYEEKSINKKGEKNNISKKQH